MSSIGTTQPDNDPALQRLLLERRERMSHRWIDRARRERTIELISGAAFLVTAGLMVAFIDAPRSLDLWLAVALVAGYVLAAKVEFETGSAFTCPSQLVLVPMLFLLPTPAVPLFVAAGLVLSRVPSYVRGEISPGGVLITVGDAWHAIGPALVLSAAGAATPSWADWPIYLGALGAQFGFDLAVIVVRFNLALGIPMRTALDELRAIYLVDALLAPIGLLAAFAAVQEQWAFLLVLPLIGLIAIFAREREARIENAFALSSAYRGTAHLLGEVLSTAHEYTGSHSRSVVVLAHQVGEAMGLDEGTLREIEFGALLHDVGKLAVPNEILNKPGALTEEEWDVMRRHTREGEQMLTRIGGVLAEAGTVVRSHHERYDGRGYPDGLAGDQIPIASRVIAACDAFNAMVTDRPYRAAMSLVDAIAELRTNAGSQFDPGVVEALVTIVGTDSDPAHLNGTPREAARPRLGALPS